MSFSDPKAREGYLGRISFFRLIFQFIAAVLPLADVRAVKGFRCLDQIPGIFYACSFVGGVHGKLRKADVHGVHRNMGIGNIAKSGASRKVGVIDISLERYLSFLTDAFEKGSGYRISGVFLVGIEFDHRPVIQVGTVGGIRLVQVMRVNGMGVVCREHKTGGNGHFVFFLATSKAAADPFQNILKEGGICALLGGASYLLSVEHTADRNALSIVSLQEAVHAGIGALEINQPGTGEKFPVGSPDGGGSTVI